MIEQDSQTALGAGIERRNGGGQVIGPVQRFDHHPLGPQVIAPDLFHQFGVVDALDQNSAGPGHPRLAVGWWDRTRGRLGRAGGAGFGRRPDQRNRLAVNRERPGRHRQGVFSALAVTQHDVGPGETQDAADGARGAVPDQQPALSRLGGPLRAALTGVGGVDGIAENA